MFFNSIDFALFLPIVFILYWFVTNKYLVAQNLLIVVASYVFYGWWDWRFLFLILFSTCVDFIIGLKLGEEPNNKKRKILLWISICVNIGLLGVFKYYNFFLDNFVIAFSFFGKELSVDSLNIILPVGISFYTFQTLSYTIDVYRRNLEPTKNIVAFTAFVSFFPQLVAGPIERATNLLPQFYKKRKFEYNLAVDGSKQILWGFFKKIVIADNCSLYVNDIFTNYVDYSGLTLVIAAILFAFQIYCDFSGYSDIAIGFSRLFGFDLMQNFAFPYFSRDIAEFWRRWHISLSTWFRDYVYIPLGGNRGSIYKKVRNVMIIFIVSGFWHGANWTFIIWGALNALYFIPLLLLNRNRKNIEVVAKNKTFPKLKDMAFIIGTFGLTTFAWIFFRAENLEQAISFINHMISNFSFKTEILDIRKGNGFYMLVIAFIIFITTEWLNRDKKHGLEELKKIPKFIQWVFYYILISLMIMFDVSNVDFIYFQF